MGDLRKKDVDGIEEVRVHSYFLKFGNAWRALMTSSVALAAIGAFFSPILPIAFICVAIFFFIVTAYQVWAQTARDRNEAVSLLKSKQEELTLLQSEVEQERSANMELLAKMEMQLQDLIRQLKVLKQTNAEIIEQLGVFIRRGEDLKAKASISGEELLGPYTGWVLSVTKFLQENLGEIYASRFESTTDIFHQREDLAMNTWQWNLYDDISKRTIRLHQYIDKLMQK